MPAPKTAWAKLKNTLQISADYSIKPAGLAWRSNTLFIVSTVAIGLFTDLFLYGLVVPILPYMLQDRVGVPHSQVQGLVSGLLTAYAAASVLFSPVAGVLADKVQTRQGPFLMGLVALLGATVLLFLGQSVPVLVVARVLQGVSAAIVWTIGLALCLETVGPENLGKTIGSIFSFISVGNLAAPVLGGVLYKKTGYPGVFGIGFAILTIDFIMRLLVIEKKVAARYDGKDPAAAEPSASQTREDGQNANADDETPSSEESPLLPHSQKEQDSYHIPTPQPRLCQKITILPCLRSPALLTALLAAFVQALLLGTFDATVPTLAEAYYGFDSLSSGLLFLPLGAADLVLGPLFGWVVDRHGTKPVAVAGYAYLTPVLVLLRLVRPGGTREIATYAALLGLSGAGLAMIGAPSVVEAGTVVQRFYEANPDFFGSQGPYAQLYGVNSMVFSAGLTVGPVLAGALKEGIGYGNMNGVVAGVTGGTAVLCFLFVGGKPGVRWLWSWGR